MTDHDHHRHDHQTPEADDVHIPVGEMDAASRSLSEALGVSFVILKIIMLIVIVAFLASGFKTIRPDEQALVLRFGKLCDINDVGSDPYVRGEGLIWTFPYPIDEVIRIPVKEKVGFKTRAFWYFQTPDEILGAGPKQQRPPGPKLHPTRDGYALVRGEGLQEWFESTSSQASMGNDGSDYNLAHSIWQVVYEISDISRFFRNVWVTDSKPGQKYFEIIQESVTPIIQSVVEDTIVDVLVEFSIDDVIESSGRIPRTVTERAQAKLDQIESGIRLVTVTVNAMQVPRQVEAAFNALHTARQERGTKVKQAQTEYNTKLTETAGAVAEELATALEAANTPPEELDRLWSLAKGEVSTILTEAETYRAQVVEQASAEAKYFATLLTEFRKRPELVRDNLYIDMLKEVLGPAREKIILQPLQKGKDREVRILINRDHNLKTQQDQKPKTD